MDSAPRFSTSSAIDAKTAAALFEKDLSFFQLLLVLINKSCPIRSIDLLWKSDEPPKTDLTYITGTAQALQSASSRFVPSQRENLNPQFCKLVHAGCSVSDKAAEARVGITGKPEVYQCHAGLIDIAVPVICEGQHIATIFTGQVLKPQPDKKSFREVLDKVRTLGTIDPAQLMSAYQQVPVVSDEDIQHTVSILEIFAEYLATAWKRLLDAADAQRLRSRESQLLRKDMAHILLEGRIEESARLSDIARTLGFTSYPNRVLIVQPQDESEPGPSPSSFDLQLTRTLYAIEDLTGNMKNVMSVHLHRRGICIFVANSGGRAGIANEVRVYSFAQRLVNQVHQRHGLRIRIGVGRSKEEWHKLAESYQEAWAALAESESTIAVYKDAPDNFRELSTHIAHACQALSQGNTPQMNAALQSLFVLANRHHGSKDYRLSALRQFLTSALDMLILTAQAVNCDAAALDRLRKEACERMEIAATTSELQDSWSSCVAHLIEERKRMFLGRHEKIVERARALIHQNIDWPEGSLPVSIVEIAKALGVSEGHLSRTFKKIAGVSFERYVIDRRIERARQLLLDPSSRVSQVAEKCDFCNPAYFAKVFRRVVGCSPTDFSRRPSQYDVFRALPAREVSGGTVAC
jgi:AraC-like DNA-binding protein/ligand-binding sensor protein